jgi:hypothetical protein
MKIKDEMGLISNLEQCDIYANQNTRQYYAKSPLKQFFNCGYFETDSVVYKMVTNPYKNNQNYALYLYYPEHKAIVPVSANLSQIPVLKEGKTILLVHQIESNGIRFGKTEIAYEDSKSAKVAKSNQEIPTQLYPTNLYQEVVEEINLLKKSEVVIGW